MTADRGVPVWPECTLDMGVLTNSSTLSHQEGMPADVSLTIVAGLLTPSIGLSAIASMSLPGIRSSIKRNFRQVRGDPFRVFNAVLQNLGTPGHSSKFNQFADTWHGLRHARTKEAQKLDARCLPCPPHPTHPICVLTTFPSQKVGWAADEKGVTLQWSCRTTDIPLWEEFLKGSLAATVSTDWEDCHQFGSCISYGRYSTSHSSSAYVKFSLALHL